MLDNPIREVIQRSFATKEDKYVGKITAKDSWLSILTEYVPREDYIEVIEKVVLGNKLVEEQSWKMHYKTNDVVIIKETDSGIEEYCRKLHSGSHMTKQKMYERHHIGERRPLR